MAAPQLAPTRNYGLQHRKQLKRDTLGGSSGVPVISYTSVSSRPTNKRPFVEDSDASSLEVPSTPSKRNRVALKDANMIVRSGDLNTSFNDGIKKTVLGEKNLKANATYIAKKGVKALEERKVKQLKPKKIASSKKRALSSTSSSPQGVVRKSTTLSRHVSSTKLSESSALRHKAVQRARGLYSSSPLRTATSSSDESDGGVPISTAAAVTEIPESWKFDIYEDSHDETMQNLMQHSATILDISDESEDEKWRDDEVSQKGKENISPERMAELISGAAMQVDTRERRVLEEKRAALGELEVGKLYPKEKEASKFALDLKNIPSLEIPTSGLGSGADFELWASAGETDDESDGETGVPLTPPKGLEKKVKIVEVDHVDESASECEGTSDKEN